MIRYLTTGRLWHLAGGMTRIHWLRLSCKRGYKAEVEALNPEPYRTSRGTRRRSKWTAARFGSSTPPPTQVSLPTRPLSPLPRPPSVLDSPAVGVPTRRRFLPSRPLPARPAPFSTVPAIVLPVRSRLLLAHFCPLARLFPSSARPLHPTPFSMARPHLFFRGWSHWGVGPGFGLDWRFRLDRRFGA